VCQLANRWLILRYREQAHSYRGMGSSSEM
jgi:hypothetical protein